MATQTVVVIRTKNEERWIGDVLAALSRQTYRNFETIIVDSGSRDGTLTIAENFAVKIFRITAESFSYPHALNFGLRYASATRYAVIISAHSLPVSDTWLADGLGNFDLYPNVAGVYGFLKPLPGATLADYLIMGGSNFLHRLRNPERNFVVLRGGMGVLGFTNAIIRKDLWEQRPFNEAYAAGGEDGEWASYWLERGYIIIKDRKFTVRHSHSLGFVGWYQQWQHWKSLGKPAPFQPLRYRRDGAHRV